MVSLSVLFVTSEGEGSRRVTSQVARQTLDTVESFLFQLGVSAIAACCLPGMWMALVTHLPNRREAGGNEIVGCLGLKV